MKQTSVTAKDRQQTGDRPAFVSASAVPALKLRACQLTWPGERVVSIMDLPEALAAGWEPVALLWHGERGSWREAWPQETRPEVTQEQEQTQARQLALL